MESQDSSEERHVSSQGDLEQLGKHFSMIVEFGADLIYQTNVFSGEIDIADSRVILEALNLLKNLREMEAIRLKQVEGIMSNIKDGYEFPAIRQAQLSDYARDIQMLTVLQRKN